MKCCYILKTMIYGQGILPHFSWSYIEYPQLDYRVHQEMGSVIYSEAQKREIEQVQANHHGVLSHLLLKERGE